jgi:hypothetical protein
MVEEEEALMSVGGAAPVIWCPSDPIATRPTIPVAKTTDRNTGVGTVESRSGFIIPASSEPDCTAERADAMIVPTRK